MTLIVGVLIAYLIGAIPVGLLVARAFGVVDLRAQGSGNIGATNVLRTAGHVAAALTLVGDVFKGLLAVAVGEAVAQGTETGAAAAAVAAIAGNCWSVYLRFRGGKGMATGLGAFLWLVPLAALLAAVVWLGVAIATRYASLASLAAAATVPLAALVLWYPLVSVAAGVAAALIVAFRHRENIDRLRAGTERRLGEGQT